MMHEALRKYIETKTSVSISDADFELVKTAFQPRQYRRRQYLLQAGEVCKYTAFIVKGAMRQYSVDSKGQERILHFGIENWWMSDRESFIMLTPSKYHIDAVEDSDVLLVTKEAMVTLQEKKIPALIEMFRILDERHFIATEKRVHSVITLSAEEKYADFIHTHPDFLERFPQRMIASYLGISAETLSRLRSK